MPVPNQHLSFLISDSIDSQDQYTEDFKDNEKGIRQIERNKNYSRNSAEASNQHETSWLRIEKVACAPLVLK